MKIAVVGYIGWYGSMAEWIADGFEDNGHEVIRIDRKNITSAVNDCDMAIIVDCSEDYSSELYKITIPKIAWLLDSHMPLGAERSVNIARKCDLVFSSNYEYGVKVLEKFVIESILMPVTYNSRLADRGAISNSGESAVIDYQGSYDFVMIGHKNSQQRVELWNMLSKYKSFCGKADTEEDYVKSFRKTVTVINQPTEPWDMILNNRFFEGLGAAKLVLQKRLNTNLIERLGFVEDRHFVYWNNFDELEELLAYYATEEGKNEARTIGNHGHAHARHYSMKNQCAKVESIVLSKFYERL